MCWGHEQTFTSGSQQQGSYASHLSPTCPHFSQSFKWGYYPLWDSHGWQRSWKVQLGSTCREPCLKPDLKNSQMPKNTLLTQACLHLLIFHFTCKNLCFSIFFGQGFVIWRWGVGSPSEVQWEAGNRMQFFSLEGTFIEFKKKMFRLCLLL